jgi:hypothetical protein
VTASIRRRLPPAAGRRLARDAGPPTPWGIAAIVVAIPAWILLAGQDGIGYWPATIIALVILTVPAIVDLDGWRVRLGMAWIGKEQRRRFRRIPGTRARAERWLEDAAETSALTRASVLLTAGRLVEARELIVTAPTDTPEDRARAARMLAAVDGVEHGEIDPRAAIAAIDALPDDQRRYHRLALAWSTAWIAAMNRRPWRRAFAEASRGIGPRDVPIGYLIWLISQQLLLTLCFVVVIVIARLFGFP